MWQKVNVWSAAARTEARKVLEKTKCNENIILFV